MMTMMNRDTRILYRQRGSNLRKTIDEDNVLVIRTPMKLTDSPDTYNIIDKYRNDSTGEPPLKRSRMDSLPPPPPPHIPMDPMDMPPQETEEALPPIDDYDYNANDNNGFQINLTNDHIKELVVPSRLPPRSKFQRNPLGNQMITFDGNTNKQLMTSDQTLKGIDTLQRLIHFLFRDNLMKKAHLDFDKDEHDVVRRMMYKLDLKIFEKILNGMNNDLRDIKDIDSANNRLLTELKRVMRRKESLNLELIKIKSQITEVMTNEEYWHKNKQEQIQLDERLQLNKNLKQLSQKLNTQPSGNNTDFKSVDKLDTVIKLLDPHQGILPRLERINEKLRGQLK